MKIRGKKIRPDKVSMWVNVMGFILALVFYIRLEHNQTDKSKIKTSPVQDSVLVIHSDLRKELNRLKVKQDSVIHALQQTKIWLKRENTNIQKQRAHISNLTQKEWQRLTLAQQTLYLNTILNNSNQK